MILDNMAEEAYNQIADLSSAEMEILYVLGKMRISVNKNVREETIKKKLPDKYLNDFNNALSNLLKSGLLVKYRPHNYGLSQKGRILVDNIVELKRNNVYKGLKILIFTQIN